MSVNGGPGVCLGSTDARLDIEGHPKTASDSDEGRFGFSWNRDKVRFWSKP